MRGPLLAATLSIVLIGTWGCDAGIPGLTVSRRAHTVSRILTPEFSPDTSRFAFLIERRRIRFPGGPLADFRLGTVEWLDARYTLLVYDLARREPPREIYTRVFSESVPFRVVGWFEEGILLQRSGPAGVPIRFLVVDEAEGTWVELPIDRGEELRDSLQRGRGTSLARLRRSVHLTTGSGQIFLWHPREFEKELLFEIPLRSGREPEAWPEFHTRLRTGRRYADAIHRIRRVSSHVEEDSVRIETWTFVSRPDHVRRPYRLRYHLMVPDTMAVRRRVYRQDPHEIFVVDRELPGEATRIVQRIALSRLREELRPYLAALGWQEPREASVTIRTQLGKVPEGLPEEEHIAGLLDPGDVGATHFETVVAP